jgi:hypothetical protein
MVTAASFGTASFRTDGVNIVISEGVAIEAAGVIRGNFVPMLAVIIEGAW